MLDSKKRISMGIIIFSILIILILALCIHKYIEINISSDISFFIVGLVIYISCFFLANKFYYKKTVFSIKNEVKIIIVCFLIAFVVRILLAGYIEGYPFDIKCYMEWSLRASESLKNFYNPEYFVDYPPFYILVLSVIGKIISFFKLNNDYSSYLIMLKLPSIIADLITAYFLYTIAQRKISEKAGVFIAILYLFNPVILFNSSVWGQTDSFITMIIVIALFLLQTERLKMSYVLFTLAVITKPQTIFFIPVLLLNLLKRKKIKHFINMILYGSITVIIVFLPFTFSENSVWLFYIKRFNISFINDLFNITNSVVVSEKAALQSLYASLNAFNLFAFFGGNLSSDLDILFIFNYRIWGLILISVFSIFTMYFYLRIKGFKNIYTSMIYMMGIFVIGVWMNGRYMYPVIALMLMSYIYFQDRRLLYVFIAATISHFLNIYFVLYEKIVLPVNNYSIKIFIVSFINVSIFIYLILYTIKLLNKEKKGV
jgi:Gpi18-like mannosyltransferase